MKTRPLWLEYGEAGMYLPDFGSAAERSAEIERRKAIIAIEAMIGFLSARSLTPREQRLLSTGRKLYRQGNTTAAFGTLRRLVRPIQSVEIDAVLQARL